jgi:hypothetical protein
MNSTENIKLFQNLMSHDKQLRTTAEAQLESLKKAEFNSGIQVFAEGTTSEKPEIRQLATLLLKKTYLDDKTILKFLTAENLSTLEKIIKQNLNFESNDWKTLQRTGEALAILFSGADLHTCFREIVAWFSSTNALARRFAVFLIENLCDLNVITDEIAKVSFADFAQIFEKGLNDPDTQVKVSSLKAVSQFLNNLVNKETVFKFQNLAPIIIQSLIVVLQTDIEAGKQSLITLNDLAEAKGKFWKDHLDSLINVVCEIAKATNFESEIRETALEIVYSLAKGTPVNMRKCKVLKSVFIPLLFELMCDLDNINDIKTWTESNEDAELENKEMFYGSVEGIGRLCTDLGGKFMLENAFGYIESFLNNTDWIKNQAAFAAMGWMAAGCYDEFKGNIKDLLAHVSLGLTKEHPRVRYSALVCLSFLLEDLGSLVQNKYYANILPALNKLLSEAEANVRVRTQACRTLKVFLNGIYNDKDFDEEKIDKIKAFILNTMEILPAQLEWSINANKFEMQEETLSTLSKIASLIDKDFVPYYKILMPGLKKIIFLVDADTKEKKLLKSNAIETVSFLCSAVSENAAEFLEEFKELTEAFIKILVTLSEDDEQIVSILNAFCHISAAMRESFYPYLDSLFPLLEKYIEADIEAKVEDANLKEYMPEEEKKGKLNLLVIKSATNKNLSFNSFAYQNKVMAAEVLHEICLNMGTSFAPYLERYLNIAKKYLRCVLASKVRKFCFKALYTGICACSNDIEQKNVLSLIGNEMLDVFAVNVKARLFREVKHGLKVFSNAFGEVKNKNVFAPEFLVKLYENFKNVFIECEEVKKIQKTIIKDEDVYDENDEELIVADINTLNEMIRRVMESNGIIFKLFKEDLVDLVQNNLSELFHKHWVAAINTTKVDQEILNSICFFTDYLEYGTDQVQIKLKK